MAHDLPNTDHYMDRLEEQIPGLKFTVPFTAALPIQAFGRLGDEYFEFCWKRHSAWLAIGPPAADQPFLRDDERFADMLREFGIPWADTRQATPARHDAQADAWVVVRPLRYVRIDTGDDEDQTKLVQTFGDLYARATTD